MEVQIQNLMSLPMCVGQVWFEASSLCTADSLNSYYDNDGLVGVYRKNYIPLLWIRSPYRTQCVIVILTNLPISYRESHSVFGKEQYMKAGDIRRYLYRITPKNTPPTQPNVKVSTTNGTDNCMHARARAHTYVYTHSSIIHIVYYFNSYILCKPFK